MPARHHLHALEFGLLAWWWMWYWKSSAIGHSFLVPTWVKNTGSASRQFSSMEVGGRTDGLSDEDCRTDLGDTPDGEDVVREGPGVELGHAGVGDVRQRVKAVVWWPCQWSDTATRTFTETGITVAHLSPEDQMGPS